MMKVLKGNVCSMTQLEGSMVKDYVLEETLGFVTKNFHEFGHVSKIIWDIKEGVFGEVLEGISTKVVLNPIL
jgi:hypothetical protein